MGRRRCGLTHQQTDLSERSRPRPRRCFVRSIAASETFLDSSPATHSTAELRTCRRVLRLPFVRPVLAGSRPPRASRPRRCCRPETLPRAPRGPARAEPGRSPLAPQRTHQYVRRRDLERSRASGTSLRLSQRRARLRYTPPGPAAPTSPLSCRGPGIGGASRHSPTSGRRCHRRRHDGTTTSAEPQCPREWSSELAAIGLGATSWLTCWC